MKNYQLIVYGLIYARLLEEHSIKSIKSMNKCTENGKEVSPRQEKAEEKEAA